MGQGEDGDRTGMGRSGLGEVELTALAGTISYPPSQAKSVVRAPFGLVPVN